MAAVSWASGLPAPPRVRRTAIAHTLLLHAAVGAGEPQAVLE
jgi:hypothetical protein